MPLTLEMCERHALELEVIITRDMDGFRLYFADEKRKMPLSFSHAKTLIGLCGNLVAIEYCYGTPA